MINEERLRRDVIALGGSAGGLQAMLAILAKLPESLPAMITVALHRSPFSVSQLRAILDRGSPLPVVEPAHGEPAVPGRVYLAPRDVHLVLDDGRWRLERGPRQHRMRPAVDPLLASVARWCGARVVGILLSGGGSDGVMGLVAIKRRGGLSIAQDPTEARQTSMPVSAIREDDVDAILRTEQMAAAIPLLAAGQPFPLEARDGVA